MIAKQDILDRAGEWRLAVGVVEKDYVLGWLLTALAQHSETSRHWVFKGGTCLKKCYFETYRFSEDLDFSLTPEAAYTVDELRRILREVARHATEISGVQFLADQVAIKDRHDRQGRQTFQGRIAYQGPLSVPTSPRVLFDITRHEPILRPPIRRAVHHPYPDALPEGLFVLTYSLEELFAEKTRALVERTRPRDLYDVVYILENSPEALDLDLSRSLFEAKCHSKKIEPPDLARMLELIDEAAELRSEWSNMLAYQLPILPPVESMLARLPGLLGWIEKKVILPATQLVAQPPTAGEQVVAPSGVAYWGTGVPLESLRFSGANRLLVEFTYHGRRRLAEPYSLRRSTTGKLLLYAWEQGAASIKAFSTSEMVDIQPTQTSFVPRYRIEFLPTGPMSARLAAAPRGRTISRPATRRGRAQRRGRR